MFVYKVIQEAESFLKQNGFEKSAAKWLILHHLQMDEATLLLNYRKKISKKIEKNIWQDLHAHVNHYVPVQQLIGYSSFYGRNFFVNRDVLIPRFETEELVYKTIELAKRKLKREEKLTIVDIGTGSGVIAITLSLELKDNVDIYAIDISESALKMARKNNEKHEATVTFLQGDLLEPLFAKRIEPHIVVSNPPYIAYEEKDNLSPVVSKHDPSIALFAKDNGLYFYKKIVEQAKTKAWSNNSSFIFEIGADQGESLKQFFQNEFDTHEVLIHKDINKNDRIATIVKD